MGSSPQGRTGGEVLGKSRETDDKPHERNPGGAEEDHGHSAGAALHCQVHQGLGAGERGQGLVSTGVGLR